MEDFANDQLITFLAIVYLIIVVAGLIIVTIIYRRKDGFFILMLGLFLIDSFGLVASKMNWRLLVWIRMLSFPCH